MLGVLKFLKGVSTFYVATVEEGTQPRVRPFGAITEFEGKLYLTTNNTKPVYKQILKNPKIEICGMDADGTWLRVEATAVADHRREARVRAMEDNPVLKTMYDVDDGIFEVLYIKDATATYYSFNGEPKIVKF